MPKTAFVDGNPALGQVGTLVTAAFLNAMQNHVHDGGDSDGHAPKVELAHLVTAVQIALQPAGAVEYFALTTAPAGWLKANGAAISRTAYSALFAAIGTTFGVGDGGTTFNLPDLRGEFVRGWDDSRGIDSGRTFGSAQSDELKAHTHQVYGFCGVSGGSNYVPEPFEESGDRSTGYTGSTGGTETRPRNIALLPCIKY